MRIDGSIKTVTGGVTTLDDKRHNGSFAKKVDNWRCDPMSGLVRRPTTHFVGTLGPAYIEGVSAVFSAILQDTVYWIFILPGEGPSGSHLLVVFDDEGIEQPVISIPANFFYFNTITGNDSIAFTTIDDTLYISNKNAIPATAPTEEPWTRNSMIVVKQAPASFSKLEVTWTDSDHTQQEAVIEVGDFISDDLGTNTIAQQLATEMLAQPAAGADEIFVKGSTILIERGDGEYANITATDGANDAVLATLNDETQDINNLPKYASHQSVVKIRPDKTSDRGVFWMRGIAYVETDESATYAQKKIDESLLQDAVLTVGINNAFAGAIDLVGYQRLADAEFPLILPAFGALVPNLIQGVQTNVMFQMIGNSDDSGGFFIIMDAPLPLPILFNYISLVHVATGEMAFESTVFVDPDSGGTLFAATQLMDRDTLIVGDDYDIYYEELVDFFGKLPEVEWNEAADPAADNHIDQSSMPHVLGINSAGVFVTGQQSEIGLKNVHGIRPRLAGNDDTNPMPEWLGANINDLGKFQDRLAMLSGENLSMTQPNKSHAWFRDTVTQQLATDPIGIKSTSTDSLSLDHIISHNNDGLIFSKNAQYRLVGSLGVTSQNAALPLTTNYANDNLAVPVSNGSDVFFSIIYSELFSGISRFSVDKVADNQDIANPVTHHVQELIPGRIKHIVASSTFNMVMAISELEENVIYVYEYVDDRKEPQTAWSRWILPEELRIQKLSLHDDRVQIVVVDDGNISQLLEMKINEAITQSFPRVLYLDLLYIQEGVASQINLPSGYPSEEEPMRVFQGEGAPNPGAEIFGWSLSYPNINLPVSLGGGAAAVGRSYRSVFIPSRRWIRDDSGTPQTASKFRITDYGLSAYGDIFNVDILNAPSTWPTQIFTNDDPDNDALHRISFKQRHDEADLEIWTEDAHNAEIVQIEWRGTYIKVGRRF